MPCHFTFLKKKGIFLKKEKRRIMETQIYFTMQKYINLPQPKIKKKKKKPSSKRKKPKSFPDIYLYNSCNQSLKFRV
jgi:hypothetical protein